MPTRRAGDLRGPVRIVGPRRRHLPVALADVLGLREEARGRAALRPRLEQLAPARAELRVQLAQEAERLVGEDLGELLVRGRGGLQGAHGVAPLSDRSSRVIGW